MLRAQHERARTRIENNFVGMTKNIFIIGNGFDLDLGLKTKYSDFAHSDFWPQYDDIIVPNLKRYLEEKRDTESWFDIENELLNYARADRVNSRSVLELASYNAKRDMGYFAMVQSSLCRYIQEQQTKELKKSSVASQVLKSIQQNGCFESIYTFNYTNLNKIAAKLNLGSSMRYTHIHGCVDEESIILGVDETKLMDGYELLHKTMSASYRSHNIFNDLSEASEVVIFGLSFGQIDYTYMDRFFQSQSRREPITEKEKKHITIFTKDESARLAILRRLEEMGVNRQNLFSQSHFQIIRTTDATDKRLLDDFKDRLSKQSRRAAAERAMHVARMIQP